MNVEIIPYFVFGKYTNRHQNLQKYWCETSPTLAEKTDPILMLLRIAKSYTFSIR
jgi:hypothetical protein